MPIGAIKEPNGALPRSVITTFGRSPTPCSRASHSDTPSTPVKGKRCLLRRPLTGVLGACFGLYREQGDLWPRVTIRANGSPIRLQFPTTHWPTGQNQSSERKTRHESQHHRLRG